jgi:hypothetical protein
MAAQGALAGWFHTTTQFFGNRLLDTDVWLDARALDRGARRRVVERRGQPERRLGVERYDRLDGALAKDRVPRMVARR